MDLTTFEKILRTFADAPSAVSIDRGRFIVQVREEVLEAELELAEGTLLVREAGASFTATRWIAERLARLPLLADRILDYVEDEPHFVGPSAEVLDELERAPDEDERFAASAESALRDILERQPVGASRIVYLTSDAGEGKTTLIRQLARTQARRYKSRDSAWLLLPIPLAGRPFLRLDDVAVGALANRLRFPYWYFDSLLALVRLGVVTLALDGFEEMFVESSTGDAVSSLGTLIQQLDSAGSVLIAARKAYFEYKSLGTQARLFDSLGDASVTFSKVALNRWGREAFIDYATRRGVASPVQFYEDIARQLGEDHALLTRAVLVRRLVDVAQDASSRQRLLDLIAANPTDYFAQFVDAIIAREAREKWIDRADPHGPLLDETSHYAILGAIAREMWLSQTEVLPWDIVALSTELYCESRKLSPSLARQVVERVKQHALLVLAGGHRESAAFDHPEFYHFFLGHSLATLLGDGEVAELRHALRVAQLPAVAHDVAATRVPSLAVAETAGRLGEICSAEMAVSMVRENAGHLCASLLATSGVAGGLKHMTFAAEVLDRGLPPGTQVVDSMVFRTRVGSQKWRGVRFERTEFEMLELDAPDALLGCQFVDCVVRSIRPCGTEVATYAPQAIASLLRKHGAQLGDSAPAPEEAGATVWDPELVMVERALRKFARATELNEGVLRQQLGVRAAHFFDLVVPELLRAGVFKPVDYHGAGQQQRFRLGVPMQRIQEALNKSAGDFQRFLGAF